MKKRCLLLLSLFMAVLSFKSYAQVVQTITTTGSGNFTVPPGVTSITIEAWGGGGAGNYTVGLGVTGNGSGGGGGGYRSATLTVTPGQVIPYSVGTGGNAGLTPAAGGNTTFGSPVLVQANGGAAGNTTNTTAAGGTGAVNAPAVLVTANNGGTGGINNRRVTGLTVHSRGGGGGGAGYPGGTGGNGGDGVNSDTGNAGSGGGSGATGGAGGDSNNDPGNGGTSTADGGGGGGGGRRGGEGGNGGAPGGGGGAGSLDGLDLASSGDGGRGQLRISYTCPTATSLVYSTSPQCVTGSNMSPTLVASPDGSYSASPAGLSINATTGVITTGTSTPGTYTVTYTTADIPGSGCQPATAQASVTISTPPTVAAITGNLYICVGGTTQLANTTPGGTWSSSNLLVATVDGTGLVTGLTGGSVTITYSVTASGCTNTATATVQVGPAIGALTGGPTFVYCTNNQDDADVGSPSTATISWGAGAPAGVSYRIVQTSGSNVGIGGLPMSQTTASLTFTPANLTAAQITGGFTVTPYTFGANNTDDNASGDDCVGTSIMFTIKVNPLPTVSFACPPPVCPGVNFAPITFTGVATSFNWTNTDPGESIGLGASGMGNIAAFAGVNTSNTVANIGALDVTPEFTADGKTCYGVTNSDCDLVVNPIPTSALTASQQDVCPNTEVTLNPNCSVPGATPLWNPGAATVTPNAPGLTYTYKVICEAAGCQGNESMVDVRTHRILVDIKKTDSDVAAPIIGSVSDDLADNEMISPAKNIITDNSSIRKWNILAEGCASSGSASFEFLPGSPLTFKSVDNNPPYAIFANVGNDFFSQATPNYGIGIPYFPNGTYNLLVELRQNDAASPSIYPKDRNKLTAGPLLASRTVRFVVNGGPPPRIGVGEELTTTEEEWASIFQNPVNDEAIVRLAGKVGENVALNLVNIQGQSLHQSAVVLEAPSQFTKINVRNLSSGLYILKAVKGKQTKTIKVLKVQ
ncbi:MAG: T9SS type A sorting domain-containing protein [Spirosomataceae bacterium]